LQSNHFSRIGVSIKASVAKIPWIRNSFTGFIAGLWLGDRLIRFTSYNASRLIKSEVSPDGVRLIMENNHYRLDIRANAEKAATLAAPVRGAMEGKIEESMNSSIRVELYDTRAEKIIFRDKAINACLEVAGKIEEITS
jgi:hypothetical protein